MEEDDEGASAPIKNEKPAPASVAAREIRRFGPTPRSKPVGSTIQLASADARSCRRPKPSPSPSLKRHSFRRAETANAADIIKFPAASGTTCRSSESGYPRPVAALRARQALAAATDPQSTASVTESFNKAMATRRPPLHRSIAPTSSQPPRRSRRVHPSDAQCRCRGNRNQHVVAKGAQVRTAWSRPRPVSPPAQGNNIWMRVVMLAPSASNAMSTTVLGDTEMTQMRSHFVKPRAAIAMTFSEIPMMGIDLRPLHGIGDRATADAVVRGPHRRAR